MPPAGLRLKDGPGSAGAATVSVGLRWRFTLSPSARTGPSRLGPAGEGRSDGGVLHLHSPGQARYPEGGRRREDEPPREEWRLRANTPRRRAPGRRAPRAVHAGARAPVPPMYGSGRPAFSPPTVLRGRARIFPAPARGTPHLEFERPRFGLQFDAGAVPSRADRPKTFGPDWTGTPYSTEVQQRPAQQPAATASSTLS